MGPWTWAKITQDSRSNRGPSDSGPSLKGQQVELEGLREGPKWPGIADRPSKPSVPGPCHPGELVDLAGPRTRGPVVRDSWSTLGELGPGPESPGISVDPAGFGVEPESPGTAGRYRETSDMRASLPGQLVDTAGMLARTRFTRDSWSIPRALRPGPRSPWTVVDPAEHWGQARVPRESWSKPRALGTGPRSPGTAG